MRVAGDFHASRDLGVEEFAEDGTSDSGEVSVAPVFGVVPEPDSSDDADAGDSEVDDSYVDEVESVGLAHATP